MDLTPFGRTRLIVAAIWLSAFSVVWGAVSGGVSVTVGLLSGSVGVLGLGLNVLADVAGSGVLTWRFRAELRETGHADHMEARAGVIVAVALGTVSIVLTVAAIHALATGSRPGHSTLGIVMAGLSLVVLAPLAYAKRRVAASLGSRALSGDATLSAVGAAVALLALIGLALDRSLGWWWADRVAALMVAAIAAAEAARVVGLIGPAGESAS